MKDEVGNEVVQFEGPYKAKTWRYREVRERFPPVNEMLHGALHEIHWEQYWVDGSLAPKSSKSATNCHKVQERTSIQLTGEKNEDTYRVWCLYFKNFESIVPSHAMPCNMDPNTPIYDARKGPKPKKDKKSN